LVWAAPVVISHELANEVVDVILAHGDKVIETFVLNRLHEAFDECVPIRRRRQQPLGLDTLRLQDVAGLRRELRVCITQQVRRFFVAAGCVQPEIPGLLSDPR